MAATRQRLWREQRSGVEITISRVEMRWPRSIRLSSAHSSGTMYGITATVGILAVVTMVEDGTAPLYAISIKRMVASI